MEKKHILAEIASTATSECETTKAVLDAAINNEDLKGYFTRMAVAMLLVAGSNKPTIEEIANETVNIAVISAHHIESAAKHYQEYLEDGDSAVIGKVLGVALATAVYSMAT